MNLLEMVGLFTVGTCSIAGALLFAVCGWIGIQALIDRVHASETLDEINRLEHTFNKEVGLNR